MEKTTKDLFTASAILYAVSLTVGFVLIAFFWDFICSSFSIVDTSGTIIGKGKIHKIFQ